MPSRPYLSRATCSTAILGQANRERFQSGTMPDGRKHSLVRLYPRKQVQLIMMLLVISGVSREVYFKSFSLLQVSPFFFFGGLVKLGQCVRGPYQVGSNR